MAVELSQDARSFDLIVIGCGGGPLETNLSSYLVKAGSADWSTAGATLLEGGSSLGALARLVEAHPHTFHDFGLDHAHLKAVGGARAAGKIWSTITCFAVSHAHLDHCLGLIVSSGATLQPRPLYGSKRTIENLERVMDGGPWPKLAGPEHDGVKQGRAYLYRQFDQSPRWYALSDGLEVRPMPVAHGMDPSLFTKKGVEPDGPYHSTAFFIRSVATQKQFLFFGDVEPDSLSGKDYNKRIWAQAAELIAEKRLDTIFIECSYPSSQPKEQLWGHLSPPYVLEELRALASLVRSTPAAPKERPLSGVTIVITHIKDDIFEPSPPAPSSSSSASSAHPPVPKQKSRLSLAPPVPSPTPSASASRRTSLQGSSYSDSSRRLSPSFVIDRRRSVPALMHSSFRPSAASSSSSSSSGTLRPPPLPVSPRTTITTTGGSSGSPLSPPSPQHQLRFNEQQRPASPSRVNADRLAHKLGEALTLDRHDPRHQHHQHLERPSIERTRQRSSEEGEEGSGIISSSSEEESIHERIERELCELESEERTGVEFLIAAPGMRIVF